MDMEQASLLVELATGMAYDFVEDVEGHMPIDGLDLPFSRAVVAQAVALAAGILAAHADGPVKGGAMVRNGPKTFLIGVGMGRDDVEGCESLGEVLARLSGGA